MANRAYARSSKDERWKEVVRKVRARDHNRCQLLGKLTVSEMHELQRALSSPRQLHPIDPAHIIAVSASRELMYEEDNVILLNRFSHENLDYRRNPINGSMLTETQYHRWWARIIGGRKYKQLLERAKRPHIGTADEVEEVEDGKE